MPEATYSHRNITFNLPLHSDEVVQDETQNIISIRDTSVIVLSPTNTISRNTRNTTRALYDPPSIPSAFQQSNKTIQPENIRNNIQQTSNQHYDPFDYSFFPPSNTNIQTINNQNVSQSDNNTNLMTQHPYAHLLQTNSSQSNFPSQNQRTSNSHNVQLYQRRSQNPPFSHISTDPLYRMNQHTTYNPTTVSPPVNMVLQSVVPPPQFMPIHQDTFINTSASIQEPMKPFDGFDHSYNPEEYLQQVEARLTFAKVKNLEIIL